MNETLRAVLARFPLEGEAVSCEPYGCGHINLTYLAEASSGRRYILQRVNRRIFRNVPALMENIRAVTDHLRRKEPDPRGVLTLVRADDGEDFVQADGEFWRMYDFVEGSLCLQQPETEADFYESAAAFGRFQEQLKDFPAERLHETLPRFHDTPDRYRLFRETLKKDPMGRAAGVQREIEFCLAREEEMGILVRELKSGELPLRVTHNDTKLNNVLLDEKTRRALCVIDLDTVMPGSALYDFGDSIRFGAATAPEDEKDLSKVTVNTALFATYARGYARACPGLTRREKELLPLGAKTMTLECGLRFLTDYLDGDRYFALRYEGQNLDRTRTQLRLVAEMERKWDELRRLAARETALDI